jgi:hypothetical protein
MQKKKVVRRKTDLSRAEDRLLKAHSLTDDAITFAHADNHQKAFQMLAGATQCQNVALDNLCSAIGKLHKALQKLQD